jgi:endonuclease G
MKNRKILIYLSFAAIANCSGLRKGLLLGGIIGRPGATSRGGTVPKPYVITEDFEVGTKGAYAIADVQLSTGIWSFNDAVIGNLAADLKNGTKVR